MICFTTAVGMTNADFLQTFIKNSLLQTKTIEILGQLSHSTSPCVYRIVGHFQHLNFDLSRPFKVKYDSVIGLPIYVFLEVSSRNTWPHPAHLQDTSFQTPDLKKMTLTLNFKGG